jgi:hypothetical protein
VGGNLNACTSDFTMLTAFAANYRVQTVRDWLQVASHEVANSSLLNSEQGQSGSLHPYRCRCIMKCRVEFRAERFQEIPVIIHLDNGYRLAYAPKHCLTFYLE